MNETQSQTKPDGAERISARFIHEWSDGAGDQLVLETAPVDAISSIGVSLDQMEIFLTDGRTMSVKPRTFIRFCTV